jgi:hypothetical protein
MIKYISFILDYQNKMNSTQTHLIIKHQTEIWVFTGVLDYCTFCSADKQDTNINDLVYCTFCSADKQDTNINDLIMVLCYGVRGKKWSNLCRDHLSKGACKKQHCNNCNKNTVVRGCPKICTGCMTQIMDNCQDMSDICKFPDIPMTECDCKYCKLRV